MPPDEQEQPVRATSGRAGDPSRVTVEHPSDALREELLLLWVDVVNAGGAVGFVPPVTVVDVAPVLDAELGSVRDGAARIVVLRAGGRLAGFCVLRLNAIPLMAHWAFVGRVMVDPGRRGEGLGLALLQGLHGIARADGLEALRLSTRGGLGLERFYARAGYVEVGRVPRALRVGTAEEPDDRDDVLLWRELVEPVTAAPEGGARSAVR